MSRVCVFLKRVGLVLIFLNLARFLLLYGGLTIFYLAFLPRFPVKVLSVPLALFVTASLTFGGLWVREKFYFVPDQARKDVHSTFKKACYWFFQSELAEVVLIVFFVISEITLHYHPRIKIGLTAIFAIATIAFFLLWVNLKFFSEKNKKTRSTIATRR